MTNTTKKCSKIPPEATSCNVDFKFFLGEAPRTPTNERGIPPLVHPPSRAFGTRFAPTVLKVATSTL